MREAVIGGPGNAVVSWGVTPEPGTLAMIREERPINRG